jgi:hypothetical protein
MLKNGMRAATSAASMIATDHTKQAGERTMSNKIKLVAIAVVLAEFASSASAQGLVPYYNYSAPAPFHALRAQHVIEGRNGAPVGYYWTYSSRSDRDALVQSLGN